LDAQRPFVWNLERNFYFRSEIGDLLFSICDEEPSESLIETVSPDIAPRLAQLILSELPALREAVQKRVWSCFRTRTPDGSFVIGWDPQVTDFFWVAGLGGHGVGASWQVGRLAAERFAGDKPSSFHDPARFSG
jgi:D-arginine dehydrogenase